MIELTSAQFRDMLEEFADHEPGALQDEAQQLLTDYDAANSHHEQRIIANRWTMMYHAYRGRNSGRLGAVIMLNMPLEVQLAAAKDTLHDTMPVTVTLYNQLYDALKRGNDPDVAAVAAFGMSLEQHYPGIGFFLHSSTDRIEDVGDIQAQLDLVIHLLLSQRRIAIHRLFRIVEPAIEHHAVLHHDDHNTVMIGDTQISVALHPKMNIHSFLEVGGVVTIDQH